MDTAGEEGENHANGTRIHLRRAVAEDAVAVTEIYRAAFHTALPHLSVLHTPAEDLDFFTRTLSRSETWLAESAAAERVGFIAFKPGAVEHLYVLPSHQGRGIGMDLLRLAMRENAELKLWTFQRNTGARCFYEKHGFVADRMTEGMGNEEREPDMRYVWRREPRT